MRCAWTNSPLLDRIAHIYMRVQVLRRSDVSIRMNKNKGGGVLCKVHKIYSDLHRLDCWMTNIKAASTQFKDFADRSEPPRPQMSVEQPSPAS